jgi:excinuclease ABC subunit C
MRNALFGPFANAGALREAVQAPAGLQVRTCKLDIIERDPKNRYFRPCLLYAIGQCTAPCADKISVTAYRRTSIASCGSWAPSAA